MENKYYTPNIEDIHVGYECETTNDNTKRYSFKFEEYNFSVLSLELLNNVYRTPYLTKEQIEAEGWVCDKNLDSYLYWGIYSFKKDEYQLNFRPKGSRTTVPYTIDIFDKDGIPHFTARYTGECPSINEFRVICKLLGI